MIKRTVEISQQPAHLTARDGQLLILRKDDPPQRLPAHPPNVAASIPCEDLGVLLVEHAGCTYSHAALTAALDGGAVVVICGRDHLPAGMLLPVGEHSQVVSRLNLQIAIRRPLRKQLWKQIVQAKIRAQAAILPPGSAARTRLREIARGVRSGDPANAEAEAARAYWVAYRDQLEDSAFRRDRDGAPPNNLLNYGYAVVRAAVARAIVAAGFVPALGLHHRHRANAFALADDLVEPLRPLVDRRVLGLARDGQFELVPQVKATLLELLTAEVKTADQTGPLMVALHRYVASLAHCFEGSGGQLEIPVAEVEPCS